MINFSISNIKRKSNPNISEWMKNMGYTDYHQLESYYTERLLNIAKELSKKVIVWQGIWQEFFYEKDFYYEEKILHVKICLVYTKK